MTYWATKYESRRENEFWATCHNVSNLFNGCWHPLLSSAQIILIFAKKQILEKKNHIKRKSTRKKSIEILQLARRYQMAAAESWPLVGSWPCSLAVTKDIEVTPEVHLCALALNLEHRTGIKKEIIFFALDFYTRWDSPSSTITL